MADQLLREKRTEFIQSVSQGTINGLLDELLEKLVLTQEEMEQVRVQATVMDKARALIDNVIKKGPLACQICIDYICKYDSYLANTLELSGPEAEISNQDAQTPATVLPGPQAGNSMQDAETPATVLPASLRPQVNETTSCEPGGILRLCPLDLVQRLQQERASEIYPVMERSSQRTRLALIICNIEFEHLSKRTGAEIDKKDMTTLLEDLGYSVEVRGDLTASDMDMELKSFAARPEHASADSTFVVFMSHGIREGICGKKFPKDVHDILSLDQIFKSLNTKNCPNLKDKPKVIIIQACRGVREGVTWVKDSAEDFESSSSLNLEDLEDDSVSKAHIEKDFIGFCSSTPDNISWRDPTKGSRLIIELIEILKEYAWSCHLEELFKKVRCKFEHIVSRAQMPTTERVTLTKDFYLFPGY